MAPNTGRAFRGTGWLHERPTLDVIVLVFAVVVALTIVGTLVIVGILEIRDPAIVTDGVISIIDAHVGTIIGALLGLIAGQSAGRSQGRAEAGLPPIENPPE